MPKIAWVDFETRSKCDLRAAGVYNYAQDISTEVICMAYAFDDGPVHLWTPDLPDMPDFTGCQIRARNAAFERLIFWYVLQCNYPLEAFYCTAVQAAANCLPRSLEDTGRAINSTMRKDYRGAELIRKLSIPQADGTFNEDFELMNEMYEYCEQDVRTDRAISKALRDLTAEELNDYHINERINDRGVLVDVDLCRAAQRYAAEELEEAQTVFTNITGLKSIRSPKMREWVMANVGPAALEIMAHYKDGEKKYSVDKNVRANLLAFAEENPDEVPEDVAEVLSCADDVWASSVAKFSRLADLADVEDGRVRGAFVFAGGSATGRASSYGAQVHNFTRKCAKVPEDVRRAMVRGHRIVPDFGKRTSDVLKGMLRPALIPAKGCVFVVADWSAIEGRVNPWLANNGFTNAKLDIFRSGRDPYIANAAATFGRSYDDIAAEYEREGKSDARQIGKVQELALGFAGGVGAFASMGKNYGLVVTDAEAQKMVDGWRRGNPWAVQYWGKLEDAYYCAMRNPMQQIPVGRAVYMYDRQHLWYALPSGRVLCYPFARFEESGDITYLKAAWKPAANAKEWPRARLWRGLACENLTQATANDLLRHTLRQVSNVVLHVHDEIVLEVPEADAEALGAHLEKVMTTPPAWATDLPLAVEWKIMERYGK